MGLLGLFLGSWMLKAQELWTPIESLLRTPTGRALIQRAQLKWNLRSPLEVVKKLHWGEVSKTERVFSRVVYETSWEPNETCKVSIVLKKGQSELETVLDLAHELVHALDSKMWHPYDPDFSLKEYVLQAMQGEGGEVQATLTECQVANEWKKKGAHPISRCQGLTRERVKAGFYQVGKWYLDLKQLFQSDPEISNSLSHKKPLYYSSTAHVPYPLAFVKEYQAITQSACQNSKRLQGKLKRVSSPLKTPLQHQLFAFLKKRCSLFN